MEGEHPELACGDEIIAPAVALRWSLTLYVSGASPRSSAAAETVRQLCDAELAGRVDLEVIDVHEHPELLIRDHIVAVPTLVKRLPLPRRHLVGDLSDVVRVRTGLDIGPQIGELGNAPDAIRMGEVDAVIVGEPGAEQVFTLVSADRPYRLIVEDMQEGAATISERGVVLYANHCLGRMLNRPRTSLVGLNAEELVVEGDRPALAELLLISPGEHARRDMTLAGGDAPVPVLVAASCFEMEDVLVRCLVATDLTSQKAVERLLEERVRLRTTDLERVNSRLVDANQDLEAFSYSVSHDLKAPLRAIHAYSEILAEEHAGQLDGEAKALLQRVVVNTGKMGQLIDDLLTFSRIGRKQVSQDRIGMCGVVNSVLEELREREPERRITVRLGELADGVGDRGLIRLVWENLLSNAYKFTRPRPDAAVEIDSEVEGGEVAYLVRDNGVGFDMAYADKLFGVFQRLHGADIPGTGIGLAIVKRIVGRHGGRVWGEGVVDGGACFWFTLPAADRDERDHADAA